MWALGLADQRRVDRLLGLGLLAELGPELPQGRAVGLELGRLEDVGRPVLGQVVDAGDQRLGGVLERDLADLRPGRAGLGPLEGRA